VAAASRAPPGSLIGALGPRQRLQCDVLPRICYDDSIALRTASALVMGIVFRARKEIGLYNKDS
jgi:hypothetical protein